MLYAQPGSALCRSDFVGKNASLTILESAKFICLSKISNNTAKHIYMKSLPYLQILCYMARIWPGRKIAESEVMQRQFFERSI